MPASLWRRAARQAAASLARCSWRELSAEASSAAAASEAALPAAAAALSPEQHGLRNIGISAHIDSGKTTLTERILFYTGRIKSMHEVRGKDGVGATMDSMDLEREKGITIQSAATYCSWGDNRINIIDTPGHVDFTVEVERALRVLDGAVLVLCSVGGVQSQSITVDRQMRRYNVPRLAFINKCDRAGANPQRVLEQVRTKLRHKCAMIQIPIGLEKDHEGVVDIIEREAVYFEGERGENPVRKPVPENLIAEMEKYRQELVETVAEVDEQIEELFLLGEEVSAADLSDAVRRATISLKFFPVLMGSAYKNKGVQLLLDAVIDYLPNPAEVENVALDQSDNENRILVQSDPKQPLVALAFKLEEGRYGQLTYLRVYRGTLRKGDTIVNIASNKKVKVSRLVRVHSDDLEDINEAAAGQIVALFGVECSSGDTFTHGERISMESMHTPSPVMSLAVAPKDRSSQANFTKALQRFQREDPTFQVGFDSESNETIISGMGELHLEIYLERMKREYNVETISGKPQVNFRETIQRRASFDYLHKKQSGGHGQYGRVVGYIEPLSPEECEGEDTLQFVNEIVGTVIPSQFIPAIEKGFREAANCGMLIGHPVERMRIVLQDGAAHQVDSSELAFKLAATHAMRQCYMDANPTILEPVMDVEVTVPAEFQGNVVANLNKRKGMIQNSVSTEADAVITAHVPLNQMFGYATELRSLTQGKGEFTMEYSFHAEVPRESQKEIQSAKTMAAA